MKVRRQRWRTERPPMLLIPCPWCGPRAQSEFSCHGQSHIVRPANPEVCSDEDWGDYVFFRDNPLGQHSERWYHVHGCRQWFHVVRDTRTDAILDSTPVRPQPVGKTRKSRSRSA